MVTVQAILEIKILLIRVKDTYLFVYNSGLFKGYLWLLYIIFSIRKAPQKL